MFRPIPLWVVLLGLIFGLLGTVGFGWLVLHRVTDGSGPPALADTAVQVASFPDMVAEAFGEVVDRVDGDYRDQNLGIPRPEHDMTGFAPVAAPAGFTVPGLFLRADRAHVVPGWRILVGAFEVNGAPENAVLVFNPDLELVRVEVLSEIPVGEMEPRPTYLKFVHGFDVLHDGSHIFAFDGSVSLQRFSACGQRLWAIPGLFSHSVTLDETQSGVWAVKARTIEHISVADGTVIQSIDMQDIIDANPEIDILELRRLHGNEVRGNSANTEGVWLDDPFHLNDVDPLPSWLAAAFPEFAQGDLLVSARSLNLIFVVDPVSLKVKWWRAGATQRQHDPDWEADGTISAYNNRMSRDYTEIVSLDPSTFAKKVLLDGRKYGFYSRIRGKHQLRPDGGMVVTSPQQGRAFEVDGTGKVVLEFINTLPSDVTRNLAMSELKWLPPDYFSPGVWNCPG